MARNGRMPVKRFRGLTLCALCCLALPGAAEAAEHRGQTPSGAHYLIVLPPNGWGAGQPLVIYNHGYDSNPPDAPSIPGELLGFVLAKGYAMAASGYAQRGWALSGTAQDHRELYQQVKEQFGEPGPVYVVGGSLGGLIALQQAEQSGLGFVSGAYALCAPLGGSRVWDQALDVRLSYDAICAGVSGGELPRSDAQPFLLPASAVNDNRDSASTLAEVALAASRCVGLGLNPLLQSSGMRERRQRLLAVNRIPEDFLEVNLYYATFGLSDLYFAAAKLGGAPAFENRGVDYGDPGLNAGIRRIGADPLARLQLKQHYTPSGRLSNAVAKVLTAHTSGDGLVVPEHAAALLGRLDEARWARTLVRESTGSHCDFSNAEVFGGFNALVDWTQNRIGKPDALTLNRYCQSQNQLGVSGACRYEALPQPAALDTRIRPRPVAVEPVLDARWSGQWYDPSRPGEGYVLELLADGRALLAWYSYPGAGAVSLPPDNAPGATLAGGGQSWIFGEGRVLDHGLVFEHTFSAQGGHFGRSWDFFDVQQLPFGPVRFAFDRCGHGYMDYSGPPGDGAGRRELVQLTHVGPHRCDAVQPDPVPQVRFSGAWSGRPLEGLFVDVQGDGRAFVTWYTYDQVGQPMWLYGEGRLAGDRILIDSMLQPVGAAFGSAFRPQDVVYRQWGSVDIQFQNCAQATLAWDAPIYGFGSGLLPFNRVTQPLGVTCN